MELSNGDHGKNTGVCIIDTIFGDMNYKWPIGFCHFLLRNMICHYGGPDEGNAPNGARKQRLNGRKTLYRIKNVPAPYLMNSLHTTRNIRGFDIDDAVHFCKLEKGAEKDDGS
jgi:hypothetical protein